jgi:hypothetical protein
VKNTPSLERLERAANTLLSILEERHQRIVRSVVEAHRQPVWVVMLGEVARAAELREEQRR